MKFVNIGNKTFDIDKVNYFDVDNEAGLVYVWFNRDHLTFSKEYYPKLIKLICPLELKKDNYIDDMLQTDLELSKIADDINDFPGDNMIEE